MEGSSNAFTEIDTLIELFILLTLAAFCIFATGYAVRRMSSFATGYLERDKVMVKYQDIEEIDPYSNLTGYEAYMVNWIATSSIDQEILTASTQTPTGLKVLLTTRDNGAPRPNWSVYKARMVTGYAGTSPNVKDVIKAAPGGSSTSALVNKYRGVILRYSLELTDQYHVHSATPVVNIYGQLLETKETFTWTLIPRSIP